MLIAQISDIHIKINDSANCESVGFGEVLKTTISELNALSPRPDIVLVTGDMTDSGTIEGYQFFRQEIQKLEIPYRLITGNHDEYKELQQVLSDLDTLGNTEPFVQHVTDEYPVRLIGIDTTKAGHVSGELCPQRIDWLEKQLQENVDKPTAIFMHHPPFSTGIWWMDCIGLLQGTEALADVLRRHPQVKAIFCGHVHRPIQSTLAGVPVFISPSICTAVALDLVSDAPPKKVIEPPAFLLHIWTGKTFVTHTHYVNRNDTVMDLVPGMPNWPVRLDLMRRGQPIPKSLGDHMYKKEQA